jgi:hypothetical protein
MQFLNPIAIAAGIVLPLITAQQSPAANIPSCAYSPLLSVITDQGCQIEPRDCYCTNPAIVPSIAAAVVPACSGAIDEAQVSSFASSFCALTATASENIDTTITRQRTVTSQLTEVVYADDGITAAPASTDAATTPEAVVTGGPTATDEPEANNDDGPPAEEPLTIEEPTENQPEPTGDASAVDEPTAADEATILVPTSALEEEGEGAETSTEEEPAAATASTLDNHISPTDGDNAPPAEFTGAGNVGMSMAALAMAIAGMTWVFAEL